MTAPGKKSAQAPRLTKRAPTISLMAIGTLGANNGLHSVVVSPVDAIQNQHSSPSTKGSKPLRNEKVEREGSENNRKSPGIFFPDIKIDQGTRSVA